MTVHRQQPPADRPLVAQHAEENRARFRDIAQRLRQVAPRVAQVAKGRRVDAGDVAVTHHNIEHAQDCLRFADKQRVVAQVNQRAAQLKIIIDGPRLFIFGESEDCFIKQLEQHVIQFADPPGDAEKILHHVFDRLIAFAFVAQSAGDAELAVE